MAATPCVWFHHVMIVFLGSGIGTDSPPAAKRIWVYRDWKFKDLKQELAAENLGHWTLLQSHYNSPIPYWSESDPNAPLSVACQTIYAINTNGREYVLGVVRTSETDYPMLILDPQPSQTVCPAASINPVVADVKSITLYSGTLDIGSSLLDYHTLQETESSTYPTVFVITVGQPPDQLQIDMPVESPPSLQMAFRRSMNLLRASCGLKSLTLQMIHVSGCLVHVIVSLAKARMLESPDSRPGLLPSSDDWTDLSVLDLFRISPLLLTGFKQYLDDLKGCESSIKSGEFDRGDIRQRINQTFVGLCGEHPGAVTVRHSHATFRRLKALDQRKIVSQGPNGLEVTNRGTSDLSAESGYRSDLSLNQGPYGLLTMKRRELKCMAFQISRVRMMEYPNTKSQYSGRPISRQATGASRIMGGQSTSYKAISDEDDGWVEWTLMRRLIRGGLYPQGKFPHQTSERDLHNGMRIFLKIAE